MNIGPTELLVILIIALVVFGPKRLPEIGRTLGRSLREFRRASSDLREELERDLDTEEPPTVQNPAGAESQSEPVATPADERGTGENPGKDEGTAGTGSVA